MVGSQFSVLHLHLSIQSERWHYMISMHLKNSDNPHTQAVTILILVMALDHSKYTCFQSINMTVVLIHLIGSWLYNKLGIVYLFQLYYIQKTDIDVYAMHFSPRCSEVHFYSFIFKCNMYCVLVLPQTSYIALYIIYNWRWFDRKYTQTIRKCVAIGNIKKYNIVKVIKRGNH